MEGGGGHQKLGLFSYPYRGRSARKLHRLKGDSP